MFLVFRNNKHHIAQFVRLALISGLIFVVALFIIVSVLAYIYRDNIKDVFIQNLNRGLKTELYIDEIGVNVFRSFPFISLTLKNVTAIETENVPVRDTLLFAQRIDFQMSILDLLRRNYSVRQIELTRANLDMKVFPDGSNNFTFWQVPEGGGEDFSFELQRVIFQEVQFEFTEYGQRHFVGLVINRAELQGNFSQDSYIMKLRGDLLLNELILDEAVMGRGRSLQFDLGFDVRNNDVFYFREGAFRLGHNRFYADGVLDLSNENPHIDLQLSGRQLKIENVLKDLPPAYARYFRGFRGNGEFYFDGLVKGEISEYKAPFVKADFGIKAGELIHSKSNLHFRNLNFDATFDNGIARNLTTSRLELRGLSVNLNTGKLTADGSMFNFKKPQIDAAFFSDVDLGDLNRFLQLDKLESAHGNLLIDIRYKGGLGYGGKFTTHEFLGSQVDGVVRGDGISFTLKNDPLFYHDINADLVFNNNDVIINDFEARVSDSDFRLNGNFKNVLPWLFLENEKLFIDAGLQSSNINFNQLLQHNVTESDTTYMLKLSDKIDFRLNVDIGNLAFKKFQATGVSGLLSMRNQIFRANDIAFSSMDGNVRATGYIDGRNQNKLLIGCQADITNVDVHDLFFQMGNFGQSSITSDNLRGTITSEVNFRSEWSPMLDIDIGSLAITADLKIENGELLNFKPLLALSRFIRVGDLNQVKFSTLENQITIKDRKIIIPDMVVNSNALNIKLSGEHTFQNEINYRLQILLSELLAGRHRQSRNPQEQFGEIIDDGRGRTTLFLLVTGTLDEPVFRYDRQGVREKIRDDFRREGQILREVFRSEFGISQPESTGPENTDQPQTTRQREQREIRKQEEGRFVIEWDEE